MTNTIKAMWFRITLKNGDVKLCVDKNYRLAAASLSDEVLEQIADVKSKEVTLFRIEQA